MTDDLRCALTDVRCTLGDLDTALEVAHAARARITREIMAAESARDILRAELASSPGDQLTGAAAP